MNGKMLKRVLAASLVLTFMSGTLPVQPIADMFSEVSIKANAANGTLSGKGTEESPYLIEDMTDWNTFVSDVNSGTNTDKHYKLSDS